MPRLLWSWRYGLLRRSPSGPQPASFPGCPDGGEPFREAYNGQYRICGGATDGTECPSGFVCTVVTMGTQTRRNHCCPTKEYVCSLGQDAGQRCGTTTLNRYFFNSATRTCEMFVYNGCAGNRNNFETMNQCLTYCNSAGTLMDAPRFRPISSSVSGCSAGQVALQDANTRLVTTCDQNVATSCPTGYTCVFSNLLRQGICCGSNAPAGACPSGQSKLRTTKSAKKLNPRRGIELESAVL